MLLKSTTDDSPVTVRPSGGATRTDDVADTAVWLLCARGGLYLGNEALAAMAADGEVRL